MEHFQTIKTTIRRRLEYIEFQLAWEGSVGRKKLQDQFAISMQQATKDLNTYMDACPDNMIYDPRRKSYVRSASFQPMLTKGHASEYLMHLEMLHQGYRQKNEIWVDTIPKFDAVSAHSREILPNVLRTVLDAIHRNGCLRSRYVSLKSDQGESRTLMPHAIACDGHRWHMRAFDFEKRRYSDFVLSRIEALEPIDTPDEDPPRDVVWETNVEFILKVDPSLNRRQRRRLEYEYQMEDGRLRLTVRQAMLFYYLRHYGFNPHVQEGNTMRNESSFHLRIANMKEVEKCLGRRN